MRKLIWLFLLVAVTTSLLAAPARRRSARHPGGAATTQYRVDAARTGVSVEDGPLYLETQLWERSLQGPVRGLVYDRGVLYAGAFGGVYAVNPATGADLWVFAQANVQFSPVAIVGDAVYVSGGNVFYALNRASGALLWSVDAGANIDKSSPLISDGIAYVGSAAGTVHAIDLAAHAELWRRNVGSPVRTHLTTAKQTLIVVTDGALRALKVQDGTERWSKSGDWSAAATDSKHVFAGAAGNDFYALDLNTGATEWTYSDDDTPISGWSAPVIAGDIVSAGDRNRRIFGFDRETGVRRWYTDTGHPPSDAIVAADGLMYFGVGAAENVPNLELTMLWVMEVANGLDWAQRFIYGQVLGGVAIGEGTVFVHDSGNHLSAFTD